MDHLEVDNNHSFEGTLHIESVVKNDPQRAAQINNTMTGNDPVWKTLMIKVTSSSYQMMIVEIYELSFLPF